MSLHIPAQRGKPERTRTLSQEPSRPATAEELALVRRAKAGDGDAFGQLYARHADEIRAFVGVRVHDLAAVDDIASATWLDAWKNLDRFADDGRRFVPWVVGIARYRWLNTTRPRREAVLSESLTTRAASIEDQAIARTELQSVSTALDQLPAAQRTALMLQVANGLSDPEIAARMGKTTKSVNRLRGRAREWLRQAVPGAGHDRQLRLDASRATRRAQPLGQRPDFLAVRDRISAGEMGTKAGARELGVPRTTLRRALARESGSRVVAAGAQRASLEVER